MDSLSEYASLLCHVGGMLRREGNIKWMCSLPGTRSLQELCLFALAKRDEFRRDLPTLLRDLGRGDGRLSARLFSDTMAMRMPSTFRLINYVECLWTVSGDNRLMRHEADKDYSFSISWPYGRRFGRLFGHAYSSVGSFEDVETFGLTLFLPTSMSGLDMGHQICDCMDLCLLGELPEMTKPLLTRARYRNTMILFPEIYEGAIVASTRTGWHEIEEEASSFADWKDMVRAGLSAESAWLNYLCNEALVEISELGFEKWRSTKPAFFYFHTREISPKNDCGCALCFLTGSYLM